MEKVKKSDNRIVKSMAHWKEKKVKSNGNKNIKM